MLEPDVAIANEEFLQVHDERFLSSYGPPRPL